MSPGTRPSPSARSSGSLTRMRVTLDDGAELLIDAASRRGLPEPGARVSVRVTSEDALLASGEDEPLVDEDAGSASRPERRGPGPYTRPPW